VTACTDGKRLDAAQRARLERNGVALREEKIERLEGDFDPAAYAAARAALRRPQSRRSKRRPARRVRAPDAPPAPCRTIHR
jgi:hypothetical protein